jgi:predicted nucleic acid-binding protein
MKYLLDVNTLVAWRYDSHTHHMRFHAWAAKTGFANLHTCAITELGFLRVSMQRAACTRMEADNGLAMIRKLAGGYLSECLPPKLAHWAASHKQTTDAYLCQLAAANGMKLATFDTNMKDTTVHVIP